MFSSRKVNAIWETSLTCLGAVAAGRIASQVQNLRLLETDLQARRAHSRGAPERAVDPSAARAPVVYELLPMPLLMA